MKNAIEKRVGIIGGGQLGKMMILEAKRLGVYVATLDPGLDCPSHSISDEHIVAGFHDVAAIGQLAEKVDVVTYEFEHINAEALAELEAGGNVIYPSVTGLKTIQDKLLQKVKLRENGVKVPDFEAIDGLGRLREYAARRGYPIMIKSRKNGYDGKGNFVARCEADLETGFFKELKGDAQALMVEEFIDFEMEVSVVAARGIDGAKVVYPVARNVHVNGILDTTVAPAALTAGLNKTIQDAAEKVMDIFDGVGTFCVEMFVGKDGTVHINEIAPRPHNSGHYTIEGCRVNQFENHIRAIIGLPLGDTTLVHGAVIMRNLLGLSDGRAVAGGVEEACKHAGVNVHIYGKKESRKGRKMGHYTVTAESMDKAEAIDRKIAGVVQITGGAE